MVIEKIPFFRKMPSKRVYVVLSLTWGLPLTLMGGVIFLTLLLCGHRPKRFGYCFYMEVGECWGGLEGGLFFLKDKSSSERLMRHEHGHGLQNIVFGPLMLPLVTIPSAVRWHIRRHSKKKLPPYNSIWFERQADQLGTLV